MPRRASIKSSPVRIFLDSGCLAGNYIREDIAHMLAKGHPNFFTPVITNVCGAFGECQLSKKTLNVKVKIFEDDSSKVFVTTFKVLRKLPYEAIIGRKDMVVHRLTLANNYAIEPLPGERRAGHPVLQALGRDGAQMSPSGDLLSSRAGHWVLTQGIVPLGPQERRNQGDAPLLARSSPKHVRISGEKVPNLGSNGADVRESNSVADTTPCSVLDYTQHEDENMREPVSERVGRNVESDEISKTLPSTGRPKLVEFLRMADELRERQKGQRKPTRVRCGRSKRKLALREARKEKPPTTNKGEGPPTLRSILRKGKRLYEELTDPAGRDVLGNPVVSSRLTPMPFTKRTMIGAAMCLRRELSEGKVLPQECPERRMAAGEEPTGSEPEDVRNPEQESRNEQLNLMTCYNVELHTKLTKSDENRTHMSSYINFEQDAEGDDDLGEHIIDYDTDYLGAPLTGEGGPQVPSSESVYIPPDIRGENTLMSDGRTLKHWLTDVCENNKPVFNTKVRPTPALVTPMRLEVDESIWRDSANQLPPRHHSQAKHAEVYKQVNKMMPLGVITESQAEYYSQVHLTPKPTPGEWRFCIDYRRLNSASKGLGWPIPNIPDMLRRLGDRKSRFFCKLDLTAGYHQAPLAESSRKYTAFRTAEGLYMWNRVPMGLKGAPSYFQHVMQSEVLHGLQYNICEIYIDDIIIFADNEEELVENLRKVLERLSKHNISVSPEKCSFGLEEIEFVG